MSMNFFFSLSCQKNTPFAMVWQWFGIVRIHAATGAGSMFDGIGNGGGVNPDSRQHHSAQASWTAAT